MLRELVHNQTQMHSKLNGIISQHSVCMRVHMYTYICILLVRVGVGLDLQLLDMLEFRETETPGNCILNFL